jgi:hypothetical protein
MGSMLFFFQFIFLLSTVHYGAKAHVKRCQSFAYSGKLVFTWETNHIVNKLIIKK